MGEAAEQNEKSWASSQSELPTSPLYTMGGSMWVRCSHTQGSDFLICEVDAGTLILHGNGETETD